MTIYITGDLHGKLGLPKLQSVNFPEQKYMDKSDYVIICGDFGLIFSGNAEEKELLDWLDKRNFTTLFIDGNHENFELLNAYPVSQWNGGNVHFIRDSVIHLMRGEVFIINDKKFFVMGGATSIDKHLRIDRISWWKEEMPSHEEYENALNNLEKHKWVVDYVLTHTIDNRFLNLWGDNDELMAFLRFLDMQVAYKHWFFGHHHMNEILDDKHTVIYNFILRIEGEEKYG